jgi:hypothetical protein
MIAAATRVSPVPMTLVGADLSANASAQPK